MVNFISHHEYLRFTLSFTILNHISTTTRASLISEPLKNLNVISIQVIATSPLWLVLYLHKGFRNISHYTVLSQHNK